ncbi:MAG: PAS domain-containing sensor histidine kinase [Acidimicrobiales bacterium]|jgi:PAS domain S-box-containing protein|nr:PAS domain-containing sensor histidine kinase [Acidimicrobiales bacterium]
MGDEPTTGEGPAGSTPVVLPLAPDLEVLFERAPEIITITDAHGRQQMVNQAGLRLLGFDDSFRKPADGWLFVHPDDRERIHAHRSDLAGREARGEPFDPTKAFRYRVRSGTGEWRWLETVVADLHDVPGVQGRVAFSRDVTESEERAQALLESQARLEALVASFGEGAFIDDASGVVLFANERLCEMFLVDGPAAAFVGSHRDELVARLATGLAGPTPLPRVAEVDHRTRSVFPFVLSTGREVRVEVIPIRGADADHGRLWLFTDDTARRDEERRQQALLELEQQARRVAEEQAERLEAYDRLRNDFVAGVSHELRTPLTAIAGATELLQSDPEVPETAMGHLGIIGRNVDRLRSMVEDLLLVGRLDAGMLTLEPTEIRVAPLLAEAAESFASTAARRSVTVRVEVGEGLVVTADRRRLTEIVENLVDNAVKFSPPGCDVTVRADRVGSRWFLDVVDHGPGIPADQRASVLGRFVRTPDAERAGVPGAGLGLAIVEGLVGLHGGTVTIDDSPGGGTRVRCEMADLSPEPS